MKYVVNLKRSYAVEAPSEEDACLKALELDETAPNVEHQYLTVERVLEPLPEAEGVK